MKLDYGLVVDDRGDARTWMAEALLEAFPQMKVDTAHDLRSARDLIARQPPDLAIIDLGLPDGSGLELIQELHDDQADNYKIVSTIFGDDGHLFEALRVGAQGYVLKDESRENLCQMLTGIVAGEPPLSPSVARRILGSFHAPQRNDAASLSPREQEVLTLLAKGFTVHRTAEMLDLASSTVAGYVKTIYRKLNVSSRAEATLEASRRGLVNPSSN